MQPSEERTSPKRRPREQARGSGLLLADLKTSLLCLTASLLLAWLHFQQNLRMTELKEKYEELHEKIRGVPELQARLAEIARRCEVAHTALSSSKWQDWDHQVSELQERTWTLNLDLQRLQQNLTTLLHTFSSLENQTAATSSEVALKVASVRTDVRRMAGLETEVRQLLSLTHTLEEKVSQSERLMVRRVGEALAGSVQRVSSLKGVVESHAQRLEEMGRRFGEVSSENRRLSERMLALESAQAKLLRTSTFAADLQPKVLSIRQEFADVEPKLSDLTLRIGLLAEDLRWREEQLEHSRDVQQVSRESEASDVLD